MKVRNGFVSNSSSSSFTCDLCGDVESGWDLCLREIDWTQCINNHIICEACLPNGFTYGKPEQMEDESNEAFQKRYDDWADETEDGYYCKEDMCPICRFEELSETNIVNYLKKEYKVEFNEVLEEIKKNNKHRKKVYNSEYINYVCNKFNIKYLELLPTLKDRFENYKAFMKYCRE